MHVMEIFDNLSIVFQMEVLLQHVDNEILQAYFCCLHILEMEPPYLPRLVLYELALGQHELSVLVVVRAIIRKGPN